MNIKKNRKTKWICPSSQTLCFMNINRFMRQKNLLFLNPNRSFLIFLKAWSRFITFSSPIVFRNYSKRPESIALFFHGTTKSISEETNPKYTPKKTWKIYSKAFPTKFAVLPSWELVSFIKDSRTLFRRKNCWEASVWSTNHKETTGRLNTSTYSWEWTSQRLWRRWFWRKSWTIWQYLSDFCRFF